MSAFIVADKTINYIVNWLRRDVDLDRFSRIPHKLTELGFDTGKSGWADRLGYAMFQLNVIAVDVRYGSDEARKARPLTYHYKATVPVPMTQVLTSLQCWLYQYNEGDVPETALYTLFDNDVQVYLMTEIIDALAEYRMQYGGKHIVSCQDGQ